MRECGGVFWSNLVFPFALLVLCQVPTAVPEDDQLQWLKSEYRAAIERLEGPLRNLMCKGSVRYKHVENESLDEYEARTTHFLKDASKLAILRYEKQVPSRAVTTTALCETPSGRRGQTLPGNKWLSAVTGGYQR